MARSTFVLALASAVVGCGSPSAQSDAGTEPPAPVVIAFTAKPVAVADLTLSVATMRFDHVRVVGDATPAPPHMGGGGGGDAGTHPMTSDDTLTFDALAPGGSLTQHPPPGLYSFVQFNVEDVRLEGTWKGQSFIARVAGFQGPRVDLRGAAREVGADAGAVTFTVTVDPSLWFAPPSPLDEMPPSHDGGFPGVGDAGVDSDAAEEDGGVVDAAIEADGREASDAGAHDGGAQIVCSSPVNPPCSIELTARIAHSFSLQ